MCFCTFEIALFSNFRALCGLLTQEYTKAKEGRREREKERKVIVVVQPKAFYLTQAHSQVAHTSVTKIGAFCLKEMAILVLSWRLGFY